MIVWCAWLLTARAADIEEEADLQFRLGVRDLEAGAPLDALGHLLASHRLAPNRNVAFNLGLAYEGLGRPDLAWRYYLEYVQTTPDPAARAEGEAALARLEPRVARVRITSTPPGATVYVDRADLGPHGQTPLTLALPTGTRALLLELDGHVRAETTAALAVGREVEVQVALAPVPAPPPAFAPFQAVVRAGAEVLISVSPDACAVLPGRVEGAGARVLSAAAPADPPAPGAVLATLAPALPLALDVTAGGVTARTALERLGRSSVLEDSADLRHWVFDRCAPTDGQGGLAAGLAALPAPTRAGAVAVFAEWAAVRGAAAASQAATACRDGDCEPLVDALLGR